MAKVLLVEDSPTQAVEMRMLLEEGGHQVRHAANGKVALDVLSNESTDIVVTDLEMPEMNGLQLVQSMNSLHSYVPAILVTGQGSEELATQALQSGAASYVPKNHLQSMLNDTIANVLGILRSDASYAQLIAAMQKSVFVFELGNDPALISPLVSLVTQMVAGMDLLCGRELTRLGGAVEHAVFNAMFHGNLGLGSSVLPSHRAVIYDGATTDSIERRKQEEPFKDRKVYVEVSAAKDQIRLIVRDQGQGFAKSKIPDVAKSGTLEAESGRGLVLIMSFADEVTFNDEGNEITIVKNCVPTE
ncbi:ATP-binding response regulator [Roseiconus nitratireducens]|uniref:ATP-binding response regulator n=1 Tax=Roseiconus nitratireducens TaxID=2605748 RepID=UPI00191C256F|nr:response regulator [Roseiconus nitratireducens]